MTLDTGARSALSPTPPTQDVDFRADPYPFYRRLLEEAPVSEHPELGLRDGRAARQAIRPDERGPPQSGAG
jgi:hypothetical protein